ncbi:hypothetical protein CCH79_00006814 [Gambusia affinis]|uniref:Uncharacterized protein n=1 Tax=Gambusia affinis TaxID=33528 RepID=A0A315V812_GAMAF|nr:hypothetical protein CCH79_00006814 [Gambusia affinis]
MDGERRERPGKGDAPDEVEAYGNTSPSRPFSGLMRNIPRVMALAASKMGNPYLPRGSSAAPMELPLKSRSFSLTSHQLRALTQLACVLLGFERDVRERVTNITFINCTGDTPTLKGILKKPKEDSGLTTDGKKPTADKPHTPEAQTLEFNWRLAFSRLVPHMEHCVKVVLDDVCAKNLQQEEGLHSSGHTLVTTGSIADFSVSNEHLKEDFFYKGSERDTPKMTAKFCGAILIELDALLPLAVACRDTSLLGVRSSFVEACSRAAFAMLGRLQERALEVPSSAPLKNLPALLASCIYVQQRLEHYNVMLKDSSTASAKISLTLLPIQRYQEAVKALREQLTSYCVQVCLTCILQDAESHDWADPKPFYEGERCSFALQMWFYFLCGLRSDLWSVLPPELAKDVLGYVLAETLQLLVRRYSRVRASYKRHLQIRCDITAVLLYVEHLMWSVSESPEDVIQINPSSEMTIIGGGSDWPYQIHILCDQLLTVLLVVTAPISFLHRSFMNSASKDSAPRHPERHVVRWLNAINPDRFPEQVIRDGLTGEAALACQLRLLTSDPGCSPKLLLQMLLYEDCHLPRILLENSYFCQKTDSEMSTESCKAGNDFIVALFNLFSCLNNVPKALTQALQPYLEKAHIWKYLYTLADTTHKAPVVIDCVRALVIKSANSILVHLVSMAVAWPGMEDCNQAHQFKQKVPESVLAKIPKDWNYTLPDGRGKDTASKAVISLAIQALSFIFTNLPLAVSSLPLPIRFVFQMAEKHLSQHARQLRSMGLLLWALLGCLIQGLEDPDALEEISGLALDCRAKEYLSLLRECLQAAMSIQHKGIPKPTVHKVLQALEERRPKWMNIQLQKARKLCAGSISEQGADRGAAAAELTEQKIGLMLLEVCHKAGGCAYLRQIYHIIQGNEDLLMSKLNGNTDSTELSVKFDVSPESVDRTACFNPLLQFDHIGKKRLNQSQVVEWTWDWPRLLPAYEGMSQVTFRSLVANSKSHSVSLKSQWKFYRLSKQQQSFIYVSNLTPPLQSSLQKSGFSTENSLPPPFLSLPPIPLFPSCSATGINIYAGNKIKTNMSECSSSSTDADQPGEKLDRSVSGLMVLLYASGNEEMFVLVFAGALCRPSGLKQAHRGGSTVHVSAGTSVCECSALHANKSVMPGIRPWPLLKLHRQAERLINQTASHRCDGFHTNRQQTVKSSSFYFNMFLLCQKICQAYGNEKILTYRNKELVTKGGSKCDTTNEAVKVAPTAGSQGEHPSFVHFIKISQVRKQETGKGKPSSSQQERKKKEQERRGNKPSGALSLPSMMI